MSFWSKAKKAIKKAANPTTPLKLAVKATTAPLKVIPGVKKVATKVERSALGSIQSTQNAIDNTVKKVGYKIDDKVGGAKGWSRYTGAAAVVVQAVPVIGTAAGIGLGAISAGTGIAAAMQAEKKAKAEAEAAALMEMGGPSIQSAVEAAAKSETGDYVSPGPKIEQSLKQDGIFDWFANLFNW